MVKSIHLLLLLLLSLSPLYAQQQPGEFFESWDQFLKKSVSGGRVDYRSIKADPEQLNSIKSFLERIPPDDIRSPGVAKSFWINAYNFLVIYSIVEKYPVKSPRDIPGFFDEKKHAVAGELLTLNEIENLKLLKKFSDGRIHFALICAAIGCPGIQPAAFFPKTLDQQLDAAARRTINDDYFVRVDSEKRRIYLSELFLWYADDFTSGQGTIIAYLNRYRTQQLPADYGINYIKYNWRLNEVIYRQAEEAIWTGQNLQTFTPSQLLFAGQSEIKLFNNLYTQTAFFDDEGQKVEDNKRSTFFTGIVSFLYGINGRLNAGGDLYFRSVYLDSGYTSPLSVFNPQGSPETSRTALAYIAPKIKFSPFAPMRNFSLQSLLLIPVASDLEGKENGRPFLAVDGVQWWNQFFFDYLIRQNLLLYLELDFFLRFRSESTDFLTPTKAILNYYPSGRWTVYFSSEIGPAWGGSGWSSYYSQFGLGTKFQLTSNWELEALYTTFPFGKNSGAGQTYNLGLRVVY